MDTVSSEVRSRIMAKVRSRGNQSTELRLIQLFRDAEIIGWRRGASLYGKPDFVFPIRRLVIFVDGCFWHGCLRHCRLPNAHSEYWKQKINMNKIRDKEANRNLKMLGWNVIRVWEHALTPRNAIRTIQRIKKLL